MALVQRLPYEPWLDPSAVVDGVFRWRLGVRPLDLADWFEFGDDADAWIAEKPMLLTEHRAQTFVALDAADDACVEIAEAVVDHLARHEPRRARQLDMSLHPLDGASRLVPEDFAVMIEQGDGLVLGAGSVCFPNRWDLPSKLGRSMRDIHGPVARLNDQLAPNIDRFLATLSPERSHTRLGWGVIDVSEGFTPSGSSGSERPADPSPNEMFVRVERETLRRFPRTGAVLFTIRTYVAPMSTVVADDESATALALALTSMGHDIRAYKDLVGHADPIASMLRS